MKRSDKTYDFYSNPFFVRLVVELYHVSADQRLHGAGLRLHLSEVKGPVMDRLKDTAFLHELSGQVFLTHYQAIHALSPEIA